MKDSKISTIIWNILTSYLRYTHVASDLLDVGNLLKTSGRGLPFPSSDSP